MRDELPDSVFPNNWVSTHRIGDRSCIVTYKMATQNRSAEYNPKIIADLAPHYDYIAEQSSCNHVLEGTGSLVLDNTNGFVFVN